MNEEFYCEEGCGVRVDREGGTCLACWAVIDAGRESMDVNSNWWSDELRLREAV